MEPVLIVTPFFAPQSHAAVFRAYKLAKLLPEHGYRPYVVTVDTNYDYHEDPGLAAALPSEVTTVRARYVEPTLRGVEFALGLGDRRLAAVRGSATESHAKAESNARAPSQPVRRHGALYQFIFKGLLRMPDRHWTWFWPALSACRKLVREHGIRLVFTSADPFTSHLLGLALKRDGLRWVADLRDPATHCSLMHSEYPWIYAAQREIERRAMLAADAVTVAAKSIELILTETHGVDLTGRAHFIPTGLDRSLLHPATPPELPELPSGRLILFSGEYLGYYGEHFFRWFARARRDPRLRGLDYRVLIVGRSDVNRPRLEPVVKSLGLEDAVVFLGHQPQEKLYALIQRSDFTLLPYGDRRWWCLAAKLVDFLALQKPVLAIVPDPSEARSRLSEAGLGIFLDGDDAAATERLISALAGGAAAVRANPEVCARYTADAQVRSFAQVFASLLAQSNTARAQAALGLR